MANQHDQKAEKVKQILDSARKNMDAKRLEEIKSEEKKRSKNSARVLENLRTRHRLKRLVDLLRLVERQVDKGETPLYVFEHLIKRIEGQEERGQLSLAESLDLERAKDSPVRKPE